MNLDLLKQEGEAKEPFSVALYVSTMDRLRQISAKEGIRLPILIRSAVNRFISDYDVQNTQKEQK